MIAVYVEKEYNMTQSSQLYQVTQNVRNKNTIPKIKQRKTGV